MKMLFIRSDSKDIKMPANDQIFDKCAATYLAQVPSPLFKGPEWHPGISHPHEPPFREYEWLLSDAINCVGYCLLVISGQRTELRIRNSHII
jgi:hypothetical protein